MLLPFPSHSSSRLHLHSDDFLLLLIKILEYALEREELQFNTIEKIAICLIDIYLETEYFATVELLQNF